MSRLILFGWLATICLTVCLRPTATSAQDTYPIVSPEVCGRILDTVFSHEGPRASQLQYSMVLRFMPSHYPEVELVVMVLNGGKAETMLLRVSGPSVWDTANEYIQKTGSADVQQIAKLVQTTKQVVSVSPVRVALWHSGVLKSIGRASVELQQDFVSLKKTGETTIFLDGSTYELWFTQGLTEIHWVVIDEEVNDTQVAGYSSLAKWMNEIRRYSFGHIVK
jgi:hypothetical protein